MRRRSHSLVASTFLLFLMLAFQNCGKLDNLESPEGEYHKIDDDVTVSLPSQEDQEFQIEKALFNFEAEEMEYKIANHDYESISEESNRCYENQMTCQGLTGHSRIQCLEEKTRAFLKCHGYHIKENNSCLLASKTFNVKIEQPTRIVSVCFDHPFFQVSAQEPAPRRALHVAECQNSSNAPWGQAWKASSHFLNVYHIQFTSFGKKILDLAQEAENNSTLKDACGEIQQANFLKLNLEFNVQ